MLKRINSKKLIISGTAAVLILVIICANITTAVQADPFSEMREKLSGVSAEEKEILQNLFTLAQEIELMEAEEKTIAGEIEGINKEISAMEAVIKKEEMSYEKRRDSLKRVLQSYQRMGPGSFIEIVINSDSLSTFLQRVNILRDLTRNTGELLDKLEASKEKLAAEKMVLSEKLTLVKERQKQSKEALDKKQKLKREKEQYLASLKGEREGYEKQLADIEKVWEELKPVFADSAKEFSHIIEAGRLPADALKVSFSLTEIRGAIEDKAINEVISEQADLPQMVFAFQPGKVEISLPEKYLVLSGTFIIMEGHTLKFQAQEGNFYGMPLEAGSLEELFSSGDLVLDIESLLAGNEIQTLEIKQGYIELVHKLGLF